MKKETLNTLQELGTNAANLGLNLMLNEKLTLYRYNKKGGVKSTHYFDCNPDGITELSTHLSKVATKLRKKWEPEFKQFLPTIADLKMTLDFEETVAKVTDSNGNVSFYAYGEEGPHAMVDDLADALLCQHASEANVPQQHQYNNTCTSNCHSHNNTFCNTPQLIVLLWEEIDKKRRDALFGKLPHEIQEKIQAALKSTKRS